MTESEQPTLTEEQKAAMKTVLFQLPDCVDCGMRPVCHDTCYEKTRVEDAEKQALATWEKARQQAFKEAGKQLNELNFNDFDFEGLQCYLILLTRSLEQGKLE
jgi:sulfatase maturation enzyme AslB (radical SAM superfamily)